MKWNGIAFWWQEQIEYVLLSLYFDQINIPQPYQFSFYKNIRAISLNVMQMTVHGKSSTILMIFLMAVLQLIFARER